MQPMATGPLAVLSARIGEHLDEVERRAGRLKRANVRITGLNLLFSSLATLLAGVTAATGPLMGQGPPAWRWTCAIVAAATAGAALTTGVQQRFKIPEALGRALACAARLRSLDLALQLSSLTPKEVGQQYDQLLATYPEELT